MSEIKKWKAIGLYDDATAEVGQTIRVKAVDENNLPIEWETASAQADWNQNDETAADYIKNRPFYEHNEVLVDTVTVNNGDTIDTCSYSEGDIVTVIWDGVSVEQTVKPCEFRTGRWAIIYNTIGNQSLLNNEDNTFENTGEDFLIYYQISNELSTIICDENSHTLSIIKHILVEIDDKFIPNIWKGSGEGAMAFNSYANVASGDYSHAEGSNTTVSGNYSHAEGGWTEASGSRSHAEGSNTIASGDCSHAEGNHTTASGNYSHAEGNHTTASGENQHAEGKYNIKDSTNIYAHIVGNGTSDTERSNAHTLDWNGTAWFAGSVKVGGTEQDDVDAKELVTQEHVQEQLTAFEERILPRMTKINLPVSGWDTNALTQTVTVNGISADETSQLVTTRPIGDSISPAIEAGVYCKSQGENQLTFSCLIQPTYDIDCMVTWQNVVYILPTHIVTFYNDDGSLAFYSLEVNEGSDAVYDGDIPTKESDGVYDYSFIGWSLTIGGDIDESALVNVVADRSVYAVFEKTEIEVVSGEWVPFCADGTTWTGEEIDIANTGKGWRSAEYIGSVVISPTNQYRFILGEDVYEGMNIYEYGEGITLENCPYYLETLNAPTYRFNFISDADLYYTGPLKVESWTGSEPYVPEEEGYVPTDGYQAFTTDGTWTGESVTTTYVPTTNINRTFYYRSSDIAYVGSTSLPIDNNTIVLLTVDGVSYECHAALTRDTKNIWYFASDGCPVALGGGYNVGDNWWLAFSAVGTYAVKVEVKTA